MNANQFVLTKRMSSVQNPPSIDGDDDWSELRVDCGARRETLRAYMHTSVWVCMMTVPGENALMKGTLGAGRRLGCRLGHRP
jgi:hypothetical protein